MSVISIETQNLKASKAAPASQRTPSAPVPQVDSSDAQRFAGQPVVQWFRLQKAMEELIHYRASGRHHNERETSEVRSHTRWKREAVGLARALADAIVAGELEPVPVKKPEEDA
jgi:hypothetical protein